MVKKIKLIAICVLSIYCLLFLFANSPFHIYLFHRKVNPQTYDYSSTSFSSLVRFKSGQQCPLCKFLSLTLFSVIAVVFIVLIAFYHFVSSYRYKTLYLSKIKCYYALAPPVSLS